MSKDIQLQNFRTEILQIFELVIWRIDDIVNSFGLYLIFSMKILQFQHFRLSHTD